MLLTTGEVAEVCAAVSGRRGRLRLRLGIRVQWDQNISSFTDETHRGRSGPLGIGRSSRSRAILVAA